MSAASLNNLEKFQARIRSGELCVGTAVTLADPAVSELLSEAGYDFTWIDLEHCPLDLQMVLQHILALRGTQTAPFVRVPSNDPVVIKPILDLVPAAVIVPMIRSCADAVTAVRACKYPPPGARGYSPRRGIRYGQLPQAEYLATADQQTLVLLQIEHIDAVREIDAILAVPGVDGICIGPNDLSGSMGRLGKTSDPELMAAIDLVLEKAAQTDLLVGVATGYQPESLRAWLAKGIQWICLNTDFANLFHQSKRILESAHEAGLENRANPKKS